MFIRPYTYLCLVLIMVLLNGNPVRRVQRTGCSAGGTCQGVSSCGSCCNQQVCAGEGGKNVDITLDASEKVYLVDGTGTDKFVGDSASCNTQIVANDDSVVIADVGTCCGPIITCCSETSTTSTTERTTTTVTTPLASIATVTPKPATTACCDEDVIVIGIVDVIDIHPPVPEPPVVVPPAPLPPVVLPPVVLPPVVLPPVVVPPVPMPPIFHPPCMPVPVSMYHLRYKLDIAFSSVVHQAQFAAGSYEVLSVAQSVAISQEYQVSILVTGGHCYQFLMSLIPVSTGVPCDITGIQPIGCPRGGYPSCSFQF